MHRIPLVLALSFLALPAAAKPPEATGTLTLAFKGIERHQGAIMVALYDETGWAGGKPVRVAMADASAAAPAIAIKALPAGRYGIKAFHDVDGNGKLNMNPFGIPTEPFAFSNDAMGSHGAPSWDAAAFVVAPAGATHSITIR